MNANTGAALEGVQHLQQSIRDILTTRIGTRVMRRDYGSRLPELVDRPITDTLVVDIIAETAIAVSRWEPRLQFRSALVTEIEPGKITLEIRGDYVPTGEQATITVTI